jgi:hypothetical protein
MTSHPESFIAPSVLLVGTLLLPFASSRSAAADFARGLDVRDPARAARLVVFRAPGFPTADAAPIDDATLSSALSGLAADTLDSPAALSSRLKLRDYDVLVLPYGSAFPVDAWPAIRAFVQAGGGLVVLGGAPLHQPVRQEKGGYVAGFRQPDRSRRSRSRAPAGRRLCRKGSAPGR